MPASGRERPDVIDLQSVLRLTPSAIVRDVRALCPVACEDVVSNCVRNMSRAPGAFTLPAPGVRTRCSFSCLSSLLPRDRTVPLEILIGEHFDDLGEREFRVVRGEKHLHRLELLDLRLIG